MSEAAKSMLRVCDFGDCQEVATHAIRVRLYAPLIERIPENSARSSPVVFVCEAHIKDAMEEDWLSESEDEVVAAFLAQGLVPPDMNTVENYAEPLETPGIENQLPVGQRAS